VYSLDRETGQVRWRLPIVGAGGLELAGGVLYASAADEGIFAIEPEGHVIWRQGTAGGGISPQPVVSGDYLIYTLSEAGMYIADRHTGRVLQYFDPGFGISARPTVFGDELYVMSNGAVLYAMRLRR
jgi:outer membrane protein assembly factor BamB